MGALGLSFGLQRSSSSQSPVGSRVTNATTAVLCLIVLGSLIRLAMAGATGLGTDESYTVANARHFAWSYVDYPPLHVWLAGAWSRLIGSEAPLVVRLPFIALFAGTTWMMFRLTALLFGETAGAWAALFLNLAPVFTLAHASWVLPDGPLAFLMLSGATVVAHLLFAADGPSRDRSLWALAGALAGLAMLTKYHGAFLLLGSFVFLATRPEGRKLLASPAPWLGVVIAALFFLPVILWNLQHDGTGLFFQANRLAAPRPSVSRVFVAVMQQALYLTPWLFVPLAGSWIRALVKGPRAPRAWFLALLASGPIVFFTAANFFARGLPHWPMPGWLFVFPLLGAEAAEFAHAHPKLLGRASAVAGGVLIALVTIAGTEARSGWIMNRLPLKDLHLDPTLDLLTWTELDGAIAERHLIDDRTPAIAATNWIEAGKLNYALGKRVPVLCLCADPQQFRYSRDPGEFAGRDILIVGKSRAGLQNALSGLFQRTETLPPVLLHRAGQPAIELILIRGDGFRPPAFSSRVARR